VPHAFDFWEHRRTRRTVTLRTGERALRTVDDSGTVLQVETAERLDAVVRPKTIRYKLRKVG
jgi:hypothetical protein